METITEVPENKATVRAKVTSRHFTPMEKEWLEVHYQEHMDYNELDGKVPIPIATVKSWVTKRQISRDPEGRIVLDLQFFRKANAWRRVRRGKSKPKDTTPPPPTPLSFADVIQLGNAVVETAEKMKDLLEELRQRLNEAYNK